MSLRTLDLDTLRTLVAANDLGGFGEAAARLGRTPSAISLQMKRLQEAVGSTLFRKEGRGQELTEAGEIALRYARRMLALNDELMHTIQGASLTGTVKLGCSQDFAETVLPTVLASFAQLYPLVMIEVHIDGNAALVDAIERGRLDLALCVGHAHRATAQLLGEIQLVWIAKRDFAPRAEQPLPLALLGPQCAFRGEAIEKLEQAGRSWRIAAISPSLAGLWAVALGGLGVTVRCRWGLPENLTADAQLFDLPALKKFSITLHGRSEETNEIIARLRAIVTDTVATVMSSVQV